LRQFIQLASCKDTPDLRQTAVRFHRLVTKVLSP
jgi:hypothetical protein